MQPETYEILNNIEDSHWWFKGRRDIIDHTISSIHLPEAPKILEIGCGTGGNLKTLAKHGDVTAIEMNDTALDIAKCRNIAPVLPGSLPDCLPKLDHNWDLIALFDVIEHIDNDLAALQACTKLLSHSGYIVLTVPAFMSLWSQHDVDNHHKRRYRITDITNLAEACELRINFISYFNFWLFPPTAAAKLVRKFLPYKETWGDMKLPPSLINSAFAKILYSEKKLIQKWKVPYGTSIIAVLKNNS